MNGMKKDNTVKFLLIAILVFTVLSSCTFSNTGRLEDQIAELESRIEDMSGDLSNEISNIGENVQEALNQQVSIVANHDAIVNRFDKEKKEFHITLKATPKQYEESMKVSFTYKGDGGKTNVIEGEKDTGLVFTSNIKVPFCNRIEYGIIIEDGVKQSVQNLGELVDLKDLYTLNFSAQSVSNYYKFTNKKMTITNEIRGAIWEEDYDNSNVSNKLIYININLIHNGKIIETKKMKKVEPDFEDGAKEAYTYQFKNYVVPAKNGDMFMLVMKAKDSQNFMYTSTIDNWKIEDGEVYSLGNGFSDETIIE